MQLDHIGFFEATKQRTTLLSTLNSVPSSTFSGEEIGIMVLGIPRTDQYLSKTLEKNFPEGPVPIEKVGISRHSEEADGVSLSIYPKQSEKLISAVRTAMPILFLLEGFLDDYRPSFSLANIENELGSQTANKGTSVYINLPKKSRKCFLTIDETLPKRKTVFTAEIILRPRMC